MFDIGHFAVWCEAFTVNFGHVPLPRAQLANVPPSLKMLGVSPQVRHHSLLSDYRERALLFYPSAEEDISSRKEDL